MAIRNISLEKKLKNKITQLLNEKNIKVTNFSAELGYSRGFISSVLGKSEKFFNLEQIEKICAALDYSVAQLFSDVEPGGLFLAESTGPEYGGDTLKKAQAIPELQELINILLLLPEEKQKKLLTSLLNIARLTAQSEKAGV